MSNNYLIKDKITYKNHIGCDLGTPDGKCIRFSDNRKHKPFITNIYKERLDKAIEYIETRLESTEKCLEYHMKQYNAVEVAKYTRDYKLYANILEMLEGEDKDDNR